MNLRRRNHNERHRLRECANVLETEPLLSATQTPPSIVRITGSTFSLKVLAAAIILLFFYYAAGVVITLLLSILLAYFLDPAVESLERLRVPRTLGAMVMVLILVSVLAAVGYGLWTRTADFAANWPKYGSVLKQAAGTGRRSHPDFARHWLSIRALSRSHVHALPGLFHAGGKARGLARHTATFSSIAADTSQRDAGRFARCASRLPGRDVGLCYRAGEVEDDWAVRFDCRNANSHPPSGPESSGAATGGPPRALECRGDYGFAALLGLGVGRHGIGSRHPHHRNIASDL